MEMEAITVELLARVREKAPLIHNITNFVVMNSSANILLAVGASPVMAHSPAEVEEMTSMAGALVLNIGTIQEDWLDTMILAAIDASGDSLIQIGAGVFVQDECSDCLGQKVASPRLWSVSRSGDSIRVIRVEFLAQQIEFERSRRIDYHRFSSAFSADATGAFRQQ